MALGISILSHSFLCAQTDGYGDTLGQYLIQKVRCEIFPITWEKILAKSLFFLVFVVKRLIIDCTSNYYRGQMKEQEIIQGDLVGMVFSSFSLQ